MIEANLVAMQTGEPECRPGIAQDVGVRGVRRRRLPDVAQGLVVYDLNHRRLIGRAHAAPCMRRRRDS